MTEDRELLEGLRALAADGPCGAPGHVEERLRMEFQRHHRRRKLLLWTPVLTAAAAAGMALFIWSHGWSYGAKPVPSPLAVVARTVAPVEEEADAASFYPLPEAEALPALENAMVVRIQLPVSSLQLMGVPVSEESAGASVQAELLLGQDGLARAVRLAE
jgi:hypothetical protein